MRHSTDELIELIHRFYPRGIDSDSDESYNATVEFGRQVEAQLVARADYDRWKAMLRRLAARFSDCDVVDRALCHFSDFPISASSANLVLPLLQSGYEYHLLRFEVSILAPYYVIVSERWSPEHRMGLVLSVEEQSYAQGLAKEIETTYGYEPMPPVIGKVIVPEVSTCFRERGRSTIYDCLFSEPVAS